MIPNIERSVRQNLAALLAFLGLSAAAIGITDLQAQNIDALEVPGYIAVAGVPGGVVDGTVCNASVPGWWPVNCDALKVDPSRPTVIVSTEAHPYYQYLLAHEARHAVYGADGPADDPNNEREAIAAGCRAQYVAYYCDPEADKHP